MSNWSPEAFEGQEDQPDIGHLQGPPAGHRSFENILSRCQKEVFDHTLSFHPIAAFILALRRSQRPPRPHFLFLVKWFLLTSGSTPDGPWRCPALQRTLQRSPKVTRSLRLFKLKTLQYGCLWIPFDLRVDAWCKLKVSEPLKVPRALCLFRLKPWKNGENWLSWPSKASGKNLKRSRRCSIGLFNVNFWPHTQEISSLATIFESPP